MNDLTELRPTASNLPTQSFDRRDEVARERLFAALAADVPSTPSSHRNARSENMKRYFSRTAAAAALLLAPAIAWHLWQPKTVLAQVAQAMSRAKGFRCDFIYVTPGYAGAENAKLAGRVFWTPSGEERLDFVDGDKPESSRIYRPGKAGLELNPRPSSTRSSPSLRPASFRSVFLAASANSKARPNRFPAPRKSGA